MKLDIIENGDQRKSHARANVFLMIGSLPSWRIGSTLYEKKRSATFSLLRGDGLTIPKGTNLLLDVT
jgi:hypothetical protein